jgi:hypothetical protein
MYNYMRKCMMQSSFLRALALATHSLYQFLQPCELLGTLAVRVWHILLMRFWLFQSLSHQGSFASFGIQGSSTNTIKSGLGADGQK